MNKYHFWAVCLVCTACSSKELPFENEGNSLLAECKQLNCTNQRYEHTIDSLWDKVSTRLDQVLPDTMPPGRRENMIKIRNASLLKQFKIFYTTLDTLSLNLITRSGTIDSLIALQVMELKVQRETLEKRVLGFLIKVEQQNPQAAAQWNKKFLQAANEACQ
jgi:hypothetical protein